MIFSPENCQCPHDNTPSALAKAPFYGGPILFMVLLEAYIKGRCDISDPCSRVHSVDTVNANYDFIVVGAGAAGPVVAGRLSEDDFTVLILEAGPEAPIAAQVCSFYRSFWHDPQYDWRYRTVPQGYCKDQGDKGCSWPRGKGLGGSTIINGMAYHRGHKADYDTWVKKGATGWSWEDNLPYFDRSEDNKQIGTLVSGKYHSDSGVMPVQQYRYQPPILQDLQLAIKEAGFSVVADLNDASTPTGFSVVQAYNEDGQRVTTARAYLKPRSERRNLDVKLNARVIRVLLSGQRAIGVEYLDKDGDIHKVFANKEVILSAGTINSPFILFHSGIGSREILEKFGIQVAVDLPVGLNLKNHYGVTLYFVFKELKNTRVLDWNGLTQYLLELRGPMTATGITQITGMLYSSQADCERKQPDLQYFFNGFYAEKSLDGVIGDIIAGSPHRNFTVNVDTILPHVVGYITLNSSDPLDPPLLYPNYFQDPRDLIVIKDGVKYLQKIINSVALKHLGVELDSRYEGGCDSEAWSDEWIECMALLHTDPQNHQTSTCPMGSVLTPELKVKGISGLRVIDASSFPSQVTGNPQAPIIMVAERGAEFIKQEYLSYTQK